MSYLKIIITALEMPDSQNKDWYGWSCNQCSHVLFGLFLAILFPSYALPITLLVAGLKELTDIYKVQTAKTVKDSIIDITFWMLGAVIEVKTRTNTTPTILATTKNARLTRKTLQPV